MGVVRQDLAGSDMQSCELVGDDRLLTALASGCHVENAALAAGISERTAYRRLSDPDFRARLDAARESLREAILAKLADAGHDAIATMWDLMHHSEDDGIKFKAAKALLESLMGSHAIMPKTKTTVRTTVETSESRES